MYTHMCTCIHEYTYTYTHSHNKTQKKKKNVENPNLKILEPEITRKKDKNVRPYCQCNISMYL